MPRHAKKASHARARKAPKYDFTSTTIGWEPLPTQLKIVFIFSALGLVISLFSIRTIVASGINLFGLQLVGSSAAIATIVLGWVGLGLLLYGMWYRESWTWQYGIGYFGLIIVLNRILAIPSAAAQSGAVGAAYTGWVFGILVNIALAYFIYKNKDYFGGRSFRF